MNGWIIRLFHYSRRLSKLLYYLLKIPGDLFSSMHIHIHTEKNVVGGRLVLLS